MFLQHLRHFFEKQWIFDWKLTGWDLTKWWNFVLCQNGVKKYFWQKYLFNSFKETFLQHFREIWFLTENHQAQTLQNSENFVLSQNGVRKYFLAKLFVPLIKWNVSTTFEAVFGKLNFWRKIDRCGFFTEDQQARTLQNSENCVLSGNWLRKYFGQNYLFHSLNETFLQNFRQFLEIWIIQHFETDFMESQPQNPEFRINPENFTHIIKQ